MAERIENTGAAKQFCPQMISSDPQGEELGDQSAHGKITESPRGLPIAIFDGKQKVVNSTDLRGRVPKTRGNTRTENRRHGIAFCRDKDLTRVQIKG